MRETATIVRGLHKRGIRHVFPQGERPMIPDNELHVVFGTGSVGLAVMRELLVQGKRVRLANRSGTAAVPQGVEVVQANAADPISTRQVCQGATVVYNCVNAPYTNWPGLFPPLQAAIIEGTAAANAKLVVAENLYMYGPVSGSITEELPYHATTHKGRVRAQMSVDLMAAHRAGIVRATAGRASDFYGPDAGQQGIFNDRVIPPLLAGKTVSMLGNLDVPHTYTSITDFGKGLVMLGAHDEALGQSWHIPNAPTLTTRQMLTLFFEEAQLPPGWVLSLICWCAKSLRCCMNSTSPLWWIAASSCKPSAISPRPITRRSGTH